MPEVVFTDDVFGDGDVGVHRAGERKVVSDELATRLAAKVTVLDADEDEPRKGRVKKVGASEARTADAVAPEIR